MIFILVALFAPTGICGAAAPYAGVGDAAMTS